MLEGAFLPDYYANLSNRALDFWVEAYEFQDSSKTIGKNRFTEGNIKNLRVRIRLIL